MTKEIYELAKLKILLENKKNEVRECKSLLKIVNDTFCTTQNNYEKGFKKIQEKSTKKIESLLVDNINKPQISSLLYKLLSLVSYSKDKNIHDLIEKLDNNSLYNFSKDDKLAIVNASSFSDDSDTKRFVLFPYGGGKQKHRFSQQSIVSYLILNNPNHFKTYYEPFLGGFGSVYNSLPVLIENGINDINLSDVNPSIINTFRQIQKNPEQVQRHLASIATKYFRLYGKFYPETRDEAKDWFEIIFKEFSDLEFKKRMNPRRAALFLYLMHNVQGGMLNFDMKTKLNKMTYCYSPNKLKQIPLIINKVEIFNKILNFGNIKFRISRFETVNKKIKNDSTSLVLFDPPYVKYEEESTSKDFLSCSFNYGINDFNHRDLLNKISKSKYSYVYYNNHNPHLENYSIRENSEYIKKDVVYTNGKEDVKSVEILMFKDRTNLSIKPVNSCDFNFVENRKIS